MNFFRSVFSDDPDPTTTSDSGPESSEKSLLKEVEDSDPNSPSESSPIADSSPAAGAWSFGGLIQTLSAKSESVIETYRRDLQEFSSGLKKEIEVAQGSLETVGHAFDEFGTTVLKGTAQIIAQGKDAILAIDQESDSDSNSNNNYSAQRSSSSKPYSRLDAQVRSIQGDTATYCEEPEDVDDYEKWKSQIVLNEKSEEIENLLEENGAIDNIYKKVVPNVVDDETFWYRYFYRVNKLKQAEDVRANIVKRAIAREEEEDLSWDVDDDDDDDDDDEEEEEEEHNEIKVGSKGDAVKNDVSNEVRGKTALREGMDVCETKEEENANVALKDDLLAKEEVGGKESAELVKMEVPVKELNAGSSGDDDKKGDESSPVDNLNKSGGKDEELGGDKESDQSDQKVHLEGGSGMNNKDQGLKSDENVAMEGKSDHGESSKDSDVSVVSTQPSMPEEEDLGWDEIEDLSCIEEKKVVTEGGIANREEMRKRLSAADEDEDLSWDIEDDDEPAKAR